MGVALQVLCSKSTLLRRLVDIPTLRTLAASAASAVLLVSLATPSLATELPLGSNERDYVSEDLPGVMDAGSAVENDAEGDVLLVKMYSFTLTDPTATSSDKAVARAELKKLALTSSIPSESQVSPLAACPVSIGGPIQFELLPETWTDKTNLKGAVQRAPGALNE